MTLHLAWTGACFVRHFQTLHCRQFLNAFDKLKPVIVHQEIDGIAVGTTAETVIKLLIAIYGK